MKVIGVGFGRTGTLSMKTALERLGFAPCYHMMEVLDNPDRARQWMVAAEGGQVDWRALFAGYQATTDWPGAAFWRELIDVYPDARVLLTVRDPDRWYASTFDTIYSVAHTAAAPGAVPPEMEAIGRMAEMVVWQGTFGGRFEDREHAIDVFLRHAEAVRRAVAPERLLVFDVEEGWGPLCDFLGVPVPDEPFPRLNEGATFRAMIEERRRARL